MSDGPSPFQNRFDVEGDLVCQALVSEIRRAGTWQAVLDAWDAILKVRRMQSDLSAEHEGFKTSSFSAEETEVLPDDQT